MSDDRSTRVISRHRTTEGTVTYARRPDGGLEVWLTPAGRARTLVTESPGRAPTPVTESDSDLRVVAPRAACA